MCRLCDTKAKHGETTRTVIGEETDEQTEQQNAIDDALICLESVFSNGLVMISPNDKTIYECKFIAGVGAHVRHLNRR